MQRQFGSARAGMGCLLTLFGAVVLGVGASGPVRAADAKDANAVIDQAIKALGGEEKLGKVKAVSWTAKGTITFNGSDNPVTIRSVFQDLNHSRQELEGEFGGNPVKGVTVLAGEKGWRNFSDNHMELDKEALASEKRRAYLTLVPITILSLSKSNREQAGGSG